MHQAEEVGLEGFLLKPVNSSMLFDTVMQAFGEAVPETSRIAQRHEKEAEALKHIRGACLLLVEDNEINQQVAMEILQGADLNVTVANDGQEAVNAVKENEYDAVLMDIQMPVMDGYAATREIREWEKEVRGQKSEVRGQGAEDGGQRTEVRKQMPEVRGRKTEVGSHTSNLQLPPSNTQDPESSIQHPVSRSQLTEDKTPASNIQHTTSQSSP